ncbi:hypothetical protein [Bordetella genomosp. 9]|uniref:Uncharacterized protein n=1 Tax=Bordetella genomosp. 9 TaxID=1416803 RepID=A0A1W6Z3Q3_9BORD|nr:hypothetical protein [Bordetella genomosp. 9]ARP87992.1 hypothetical protein CAL13_18565 [Bordetella genomosp. 9]
MIPVALPGGNFYPILAVSLVCLATLLTWIAVLCTNRIARLRLRAHPRANAAAMLVLALVGGIFPVRQAVHWFEARQAAEKQAAHTLVLDAPRTLDGIAMPAGTRLLLHQRGRPESYETAHFPRPVPVDGIAVASLQRYLAKSDANTFRAIGASGVLPEDEIADGWRCSRGHKVEFKAADDGRLRFTSCHLAGGNTLDGQPLPAGTWVALRQGARPASDFRHVDGWLLRTDGSEPSIVAGMPLLKAELRLDRDRRLVWFEGSLGKEYALGPMTYPTGTRVATASATLEGARPGDLVFSPSRGRAAGRNDGDDVPAGQSVLQAADGAVRAVMSNRAAGVLDFASIGVTP